MIGRFLILFLAFATLSRADEISRLMPKDPTMKVVPSDLTQKKPPSGIEELGIETGPCYGTCPVYTLIVKKDGTLHYRGNDFVKQKGEYVAKIDSWMIDPVFEYAAALDVFDYLDFYTASITDCPTTYLMVKTGTRTKVIEDYANSAPIKIRVLEKLIAELLRDARLKKQKWSTGEGAPDKH